MSSSEGRSGTTASNDQQTVRGRAGRYARRAWPVALVIGGVVMFLMVWGNRDPVSLRAQIEQLIQSGQLDQAEVLLDQLASSGETSPEESILRARIALGRNQSEEAREWLRRVPEAHPTIAVAWLRTGQTDLRNYRFRQAELALTEALRLDPTIDPARRELIYLYGYQLRRAEAREQFLELADPMRLEASEVLVWCLLRRTTWNPKEAAETLARCVEVDPKDRWSRLALVQNELTLVRFEEARRHLDQLPRSDPAAIALRVELALEEQDIARAEALLASAPRGHPDLEYVRGRLALALGNHAEAFEALDRARNAGPLDEEKILRNLATAMRRLGREEQAREVLKRAEALTRFNQVVEVAVGASRSDDDAELYRRLGEAARAADLQPEARAWFQLALARDPFDTTNQRVLAEIESRIRAEQPERPGSE